MDNLEVVDNERFLLLLMKYIGRPITPLKKLQKILYVVKYPEAFPNLFENQEKTSLPCFEFYPEDFFVGPYSEQVTRTLDNLAYDRYIYFKPIFSERYGGPHSQFILAPLGEIKAKEIEKKINWSVKKLILSVAELYNKIDQKEILSNLCLEETKHYSKLYPEKYEEIIRGCNVLSTALIYTSRKLRFPDETATKIASGLEKEFSLVSKVGEVRKLGHRLYVPFRIKVKPEEFFRDVAPLLEEPGIGDLLKAACENEYEMYLFKNGVAAYRYVHKPFKAVPPRYSFYGSLITTRHFQNVCNKVLTSIFLSTYMIANPRFVSWLGKRDMVYKVISEEGGVRTWLKTKRSPK